MICVRQVRKIEIQSLEKKRKANRKIINNGIIVCVMYLIRILIIDINYKI